jgi:hypothetical protein
MSSRRRGMMIDSNNNEVIKRIKEEEQREKRNQEDRIRAIGEIVIQERKKIREIDDEKIRKERKEIIENITKKTQQRAEEHRRLIEELKKQSELTKREVELSKKEIELSKKARKQFSDQIKAFEKYVENEKVNNKFIDDNISYLRKCLSVLNQELKVKHPPRNNIEGLIKTVEEYISELNKIKNMSISDKLEKSKERIISLNRLNVDIGILDKVLRQPTDTPASGGSKLPVKRRAKPNPNAKPKTNVVKTKPKPKPKSRSNKGVR